MPTNLAMQFVLQQYSSYSVVYDDINCHFLLFYALKSHILLVQILTPFKQFMLYQKAKSYRLCGLVCGMNVHKRCEKNVANNCGINTKDMAAVLNQLGISGDKLNASKRKKVKIHL